VFVNLSNHNKPIIVAKLSKGDEVSALNEYQFEIVKSSDKSVVQIIGNRSQNTLSVRVQNNDGSSQLSMSCLSSNRTAKINIVSQGEMNVESDNLTIIVDKIAKIVVGNKKNKITVAVDEKSIDLYDINNNRIALSGDGVVVSAKSVVLGDDSAQETLLSQNLLLQLKLSKLRLDTLIAAIKGAPIVPSDGGASFKAFLVAATSSLKSEDYFNVTSKIVKNS
jgi:hypothetical protein